MRYLLIIFCVSIMLFADVYAFKYQKNKWVYFVQVDKNKYYKNNDKTTGNPTVIGDDVTIGHRVMLHGCTIEDACLIGMSATILDGAVIGKESIVGAGSLVTKNKKFPPRSLIIGSPAKVVRELTDEEVAELYASAKRYVEFKNQYM